MSHAASCRIPSSMRVAIFHRALEATMTTMRTMGLSLVVLAPLIVTACGGSNAVSCNNAGGPVSGAADTHCGTTIQATIQASCHLPTPDAGVTDAGTGTTSNYGPTMDNVEGD